ncbi:hypothetical protein OIU35_19985 [Boseaceae bacterium BT-24-1]|nr:hypothetical protein [Boseaceae bacterium BT-24-1]
MRFSERLGLTPVRLHLQRDAVDEALRAGLWTALKTTVLDFQRSYGAWDDRYYMISKRVIVFFFKVPIDSAPNDADVFVSNIRKWFFAAKWFQLYDLIEFMYENGYSDEYDQDAKIERFSGLVNQFLEQEKSAFRLVAGHVTELTGDSEINEIEEAAASKGKFSGVSLHIKSAVGLYSDRKNPDYRNSVKEAICAVEAAARTICQDDKATLGAAVKAIDKSHTMHPALKEGLLKIYGYSSDEGGIRHALTDQSKVDHADAKFMIVSCSAFCNFLIEKYGVQTS